MWPGNEAGNDLSLRPLFRLTVQAPGVHSGGDNVYENEVLC